jgi:hypothetical protein
MTATLPPRTCHRSSRRWDAHEVAEVSVSEALARRYEISLGDDRVHDRVMVGEGASEHLEHFA